MIQVEVYDSSDASTGFAARWMNPYLEMRRQVFVEQKAWELDTWRGIEFDNYDLPSARYIFAHTGGQLVAAARLLQCSHSTPFTGGRVTYMINDAWEGRLVSIPSGICEHQPPRSTEAWELSRLVSPQLEYTKSILLAANAFIEARGGTRCLFLASPVFMRLGRSIGFSIEKLGPTFEDETGQRYCAMSTPTLDSHP